MIAQDTDPARVCLSGPSRRRSLRREDQREALGLDILSLPAMDIIASPVETAELARERGMKLVALLVNAQGIMANRFRRHMAHGQQMTVAGIEDAVEDKQAKAVVLIG
jgi:hypothetical protein